MSTAPEQLGPEQFGPEPAGWQPTGRIDLGRLPLTGLAQGIGALLLFLALQLPWYTFSAASATGSASAMQAGGWRWLIWLLSLATVVYLFLCTVTSWRDPPWLADAARRRKVLAGVAALDFLLVLFAAFASKGTPPHVAALPAGVAVGTAIGGYLAVVLALGILAASVVEIMDSSPSTGRAPRQRQAPLPEPAAAPASRPPATAPQSPRPAARPTYPPQRPAEPGSGPPTGWMPPQPPPPPPL